MLPSTKSAANAARLTSMARRSSRLLRVAFRHHPHWYLISCEFPLVLLERLPEEAGIDKNVKATRNREVVCSIRGRLPRTLMIDMLPYTDSAKVRWLNSSEKRLQKMKPARYCLRFNATRHRNRAMASDLKNDIARINKIHRNPRRPKDRGQSNLGLVKTGVLMKRRRRPRVISPVTYGLHLRRNSERIDCTGRQEARQLLQSGRITSTPYSLRLRNVDQRSDCATHQETRQLLESKCIESKRLRRKRNRKPALSPPRKSPRLLKAQRTALTIEDNDFLKGEISLPKYRNRRCRLLSDDDDESDGDDDIEVEDGFADDSNLSSTATARNGEQAQGGMSSVDQKCSPSIVNNETESTTAAPTYLISPRVQRSLFPVKVKWPLLRKAVPGISPLAVEGGQAQPIPGSDSDVAKKNKLVKDTDTAGEQSQELLNASLNAAEATPARRYNPALFGNPGHNSVNYYSPSTVRANIRWGLLVNGVPGAPSDAQVSAVTAQSPFMTAQECHELKERQFRVKILKAIHEMGRLRKDRSPPSLINRFLGTPTGPLRPSESRALTLVQRALRGNPINKHEPSSDETQDPVPSLSSGTPRRTSTGYVQYFVDL